MAAETAPTSFLPYHEPGIVDILIQASFLLVLNVVNHFFDILIYCGLLGQVFIGVAWGTPGGRLLDQAIEGVIVQLGYLGLILLVYEGGLETSFKSLRSNALLSVLVALTGICTPMGLSFALMGLVNATPLQAFAAGAALCSTSLGTTFTILAASGLSATKVGTVLTTAAMLDDIAGLVMVQVVSNLGTAASSFTPVTVIRPVAVSFGFIILVPLTCIWVAKPLTFWLNAHRKANVNGLLSKAACGLYTPFIVHTALLLSLVTAASYAGTSNLFAAYLAGASISWWDSELPHVDTSKVVGANDTCTANESVHGEIAPELVTRPINPAARDNHSGSSTTGLENMSHGQSNDETTGQAVYHKFYSVPVQSVLKPFFFASIGFAIPLTEMFSGDIVWRGIVYTILMLFAKLVTGLWLVQLNISSPQTDLSKYGKIVRRLLPKSWQHPSSKKAIKSNKSQSTTGGNVMTTVQETGSARIIGNVASQRQQNPESVSVTPNQHQKYSIKPLSLYPAGILGTAMTARGEIGFLIASLAETTGVFSSTSDFNSKSSKIYLVVTWAIVLCTIIGPLSVGTLVKRVRRLQAAREQNPSKPDPLGVWGVD